MARSSSGLLSQIEDGALDSSVPLADTLRKCVALGGRADSPELRDWAKRELEGYGPDDDLPDYRTVGAAIAIDGSNMHAIIHGQQIAHSTLPDFARDLIKPEVELRYGVAQLEDMIRASDKGNVKLQHPLMPDLARYMDSQAPYGNNISNVYWQVAANTLVGVLDRTRTTLVALVAEMRAAGVDQQDVPSPEAAHQAVNVVFHKAKRSIINVNTSQSGSGTAATQSESSQAAGSDKAQLPGWIRGPWGLLVGVATIVGGVAAVATWQGWGPL